MKGLSSDLTEVTWASPSFSGSEGKVWCDEEDQVSVTWVNREGWESGRGDRPWDYLLHRIKSHTLHGEKRSHLAHHGHRHLLPCDSYGGSLEHASRNRWPRLPVLPPAWG